MSPKLALSNIPDRNPFFTGRERVLTQLQEALADRGRAALSGLGGIGKTQTAVEYAHRHFEEYDHIFWVTSDSLEALVSGYATVADLLKLPEANAQNQMLTVEAVKRWLSSNEGWLLLLDNADDLAMARTFLPVGDNGHALLTTQSRAVGTMARVEVETMGIQEGTLFVLRRAKCIDEDAPLEAAAPTDRARANEIALQLGVLPLALDQAAAYIEETDCGLSGYLDLYRSHASELLRQRGALASDHLEPVVSTWALSFEKVGQANPGAAELLYFCAFLNPDAIPEELFSKGAAELGPVLEPVGSNAFALNRAVAEILKYSLLHRDSNAHTLQIHCLVQAVLKQEMDEATQRRWAERTVRAVNDAFPTVKFHTWPEFSLWPVCERFLAQAHRCTELIEEWCFESTEAARLLDNAGFYLFARARYTEAEPFYQRALTIREKLLGPEHPDVAWRVSYLGVLYSRQGRYAEAEPLFERALLIWEQALGPEHTQVAWGLHDLATLNKRQGRYAQAEPLFERALLIWEQALGAENPQVTWSLNSLATLYDRQGRYAEAEPLLQRALAIQEKALGPDHPGIAWNLNPLGALYVHEGRYTEAEPLFKRALAIREKALGPSHPDLAWSLNPLGALYDRQGRYAEAELLLQRAVTIREKALGLGHPDLAWSLHDLGALYVHVDRCAEAEPLLQRALAIQEKTLGPSHPDVAWSLHDLGALYVHEGRYAEAEPLFRRALAIREKALGSSHPDVATSLEDYASLLRNTRRSEEAALLESRAKAIRCKSA